MAPCSPSQGETGGQIGERNDVSPVPKNSRRTCISLLYGESAICILAYAGLLHRYYFAHRVVSDDVAMTEARLLLVTAVRIVLRNGLSVLGISAPEQM